MATWISVTCDRCSGVGFLRHYSHIAGGRCFACGGSGTLRVRS